MALGVQPTVLVVDDNPTIRRLLSLYLKGEEFQVVGETANGREAVELVAERRPDIVLMDLALQELSGFEATHQITTRFPETIVVVISARTDMDAAREAMASGARDYLAKPIAREDLIQTLRKLYETPKAVLIHGSSGPSGGTGIWAFVGVNVGDGRSALAISVAYELLTNGRKVALVDTNPLHGDIAFQLGVANQGPFLTELLQHPSYLIEKVIRGHLKMHDSGLAVLAGAPTAGDGYGISYERMREVLAALADLYDMVVMDCSFGILEELVPVLDSARYVFPCGAASPHGVRDLLTMHTIMDGLGYQPPKLCPLMLHCDERGADYWLEGTKVQAFRSFPDAPELYIRTLKASQPLPRIAPRSDLSRIARTMTQELSKSEGEEPSSADPVEDVAPEPKESTDSKPGFFGRLLRRG